MQSYNVKPLPGRGQHKLGVPTSIHFESMLVFILLYCQTRGNETLLAQPNTSRISTNKCVHGDIHACGILPNFSLETKSIPVAVKFLMGKYVVHFHLCEHCY